MRELQYIFFGLAFLLCHSLWAQSLWVEGVLLHSQTRQPVAGVKVLEKGSFNITYTDEKGRYALEVLERPLEMVFVHKKFKTRLMHQETDSLQVLLEPIDLHWHAPPISDEVGSFDKLAARVMDFRFYDQLILLLGNSGQEVRLIDKNGKLIERSLTPDKMIGLTKDCLGSLYLYNSDSAYQVFYDYRDIHFINSIPAIDFEEYILPCRCYFQGGLIFTESSRRNLITAVKYGTKKGIVATLREFADSNALELLNEKYNREYFTNRGLQGKDAQVFMGSISEHELEEKQEEARLSWLDAYSIRPNKIFAFAGKNHFSLYDLKEMKQYFYTSIDSPPVVSELDMPRANAQAMLRDEVSGEIYVLYKVKSRINFRPVRSSLEEIKVDEFPFPKHVQILNEQVYFISNPALDGGNYLFRRN